MFMMDLWKKKTHDNHHLFTVAYTCAPGVILSPWRSTNICRRPWYVHWAQRRPYCCTYPEPRSEESGGLLSSRGEDWPNTTTLKRNMEGLVYYIYKYIYIMCLPFVIICYMYSAQSILYDVVGSMWPLEVYEKIPMHIQYTTHMYVIIWYGMYCVYVFVDILMLDLI